MLLLVKPGSFYFIGTKRQKKIMINTSLRIRKNYPTPPIWNIRILPFKAAIIERADGSVAPGPTPTPIETHTNLLSTSTWGIKTLQLSLNFLGSFVTWKNPRSYFLAITLLSERIGCLLHKPQADQPNCWLSRREASTVHPTQKPTGISVFRCRGFWP